jgi:DNA-directed RNA polymerase specialized sigma24 family protein
VLQLDDGDLVRIGGVAADSEHALSLDQLPAAQRDAVRARVLEDVDYRDLAARMGCSEQLVRQHVSHGLRRLRTQLEEQR